MWWREQPKAPETVQPPFISRDALLARFEAGQVEAKQETDDRRERHRRVSRAVAPFTQPFQELVEFSKEHFLEPAMLRSYTRSFDDNYIYSLSVYMTANPVIGTGTLRDMHSCEFRLDRDLTVIRFEVQNGLPAYQHINEKPIPEAILAFVEYIAKQAGRRAVFGTKPSNE